MKKFIAYNSCIGKYDGLLGMAIMDKPPKVNQNIAIVPPKNDTSYYGMFIDNDIQYIGRLLKGLPHGFGVVIENQEDIFIGTFRDGICDGPFIYIDIKHQKVEELETDSYDVLTNVSGYSFSQMVQYNTKYRKCINSVNQLGEHCLTPKSNDELDGDQLNLLHQTFRQLNYDNPAEFDVSQPLIIKPVVNTQEGSSFYCYHRHLNADYGVMVANDSIAVGRWVNGVLHGQDCVDINLHGLKIDGFLEVTLGPAKNGFFDGWIFKTKAASHYDFNNSDAAWFHGQYRRGVPYGKGQDTTAHGLFDGYWKNGERTKGLSIIDANNTCKSWWKNGKPCGPTVIKKQGKTYKGKLVEQGAQWRLKVWNKYRYCYNYLRKTFTDKDVGYDRLTSV